MRICAAQIRPVKGNIKSNIALHREMILAAAAQRADLIVFPELSLTGYEPELANELAIATIADERLDEFQLISNEHDMVICLGIPLRVASGIQIGMVIFQPGKPRSSYSKQMLHDDELPYFVPGDKQLILEIKGHHIAPAICYESLQPGHAAQALTSGADIYLASVAKPAGGVAKAYKHYPLVAQQQHMTVIMANCVGFCDNFESTGSSAVWGTDGALLRSLGPQDEGLLITDTETKQTATFLLA